jgi:CDP-diacylglycerol--glycerol-3-phosphate 3-phosphatidyltransferase
MSAIPSPNPPAIPCPAPARGAFAWVPNAITGSRGACGVAVAGLLLGGWRLSAFWLFIFAVSTDLVDGWLARKLDAVSDTGRWLDPLSDKMLAMTTWSGLLLIGWVPFWLAGLVLLRDLLVLIAWIVAQGRELDFSPTLAGRLKISFEGVALPLLLLHHTWAGVQWESAGVILGVITLLLSVWSAGEYAVQWRAARPSVG